MPEVSKESAEIEERIGDQPDPLGAKLSDQPRLAWVIVARLLTLSKMRHILTREILR